MADLNEAALAETAKACRDLGVKASITKLDVSSRAAVEAWANDTVREFGQANVIVNNAGVGLSATVADMAYDDFEWLMNINFWGVVYGTKAFLPHLKNSGDGHVVNISSVAGLIAAPTMSAYTAAKFAVRGFTEALREEMDIEGWPVGVTSVHPGGIRTNIARNSRMKTGSEWGMKDQEDGARQFEKIARTTPEQAADRIVSAILNNRRRQLIGPDAVMIDLVQRMMPVSYQRMLVAGAKLQRGRNTTAGE